jgi:crotonobetainyl-CoA:carnitine CoA-transferase CaiB-like acyl-CoA transferase
MPTGPLEGIVVVEAGGQLSEFAGRILAGGGADVIKVEPPGGSPTRRIGPFHEDTPHPDRSLYFWQYNLGKRGITLDLDSEDGQALFRSLAAAGDVVLDGTPPGWLGGRGLGHDDLAALNPRLISCAVTPFGQWGPYRDFAGGDLVQLALGGQMMVCGYDPAGDFDPAQPASSYDTPPIAPQMWHSLHVSGVNAAIAVTGALLARETTGAGQFIDVSAHEALAACTELAVPMWIYNGAPMFRQTGRHAFPAISQPFQYPTGDGKWMMAMGSIGFGESWRRFVQLLQSYGVAGDLADPRYEDVRYRSQPGPATHISEITQLLLATGEAEDLMRSAQELGLPWSVVRRPEENLDDPHWEERGAFAQVEHPELGKSYTYLGGPWVSADMPWVTGPRAPLVGEHTAVVLRELLGLTGTDIERLAQGGVI